MLDQKYELIQEQLQECLPEQFKEFTSMNYKSFIALQKENDPLYKQFQDLIDRFSAASILIDSLNTEITTLSESRSRCVRLLESNEAINSDAISGEDIQAEDQIIEMLDNLSSSSFDKNYKQSMEFYQLLKEMLSSQKFVKLIKRKDIRKQIDLTYRALSQSILNDLTQEGSQHTSQELLEYLLVLNQVQLAITGFLEVHQTKLNNWVQQQTQLDQKTVKQFMETLLKVNQLFEQSFSKYLKHNQALFSFISQWNNQSIQQFYATLSTNSFQNVITFDDLYSVVKSILQTFNAHNQQGVQLDFPIQKELVFTMEQQVSIIYSQILEMFDVYGSKISQLFQLGNQKLFTCYLMQSLLQYDELFSENLKSITFEPIVNASQPQEIKVKSNTTLKNIFDQLSQPMGINSIYFWNFVYKLADSTLNFLNPKEYGVLSVQLANIVQKLIIQFIYDYLKATNDNKVQSESQQSLLFEIGNYFGNFNLCNTLSQYLVHRTSLQQFPQSSEWKTLIQSWYDSVKINVNLYYKVTLLDKLPFWIGDLGKVYCQKQQATPQVQRPTPLFLMIAFSIVEIRNQLVYIMPKMPLQYFVNSLWDYIKYIVEYVLYWNYHGMGKNSEVFFLDKKSREELKLDMAQINLYLQQNSVKVTHITLEGLNQLIFDLMFIQELYSKCVSTIQNDIFLKKLITLYCREKKLEQNIFNTDQKHYQGALNVYFEQKYEKDMLQAKQFIEQQRKIS